MDLFYFSISFSSFYFQAFLNDITKYKTALSTYETKTYKYPKAINESKRLPEISIVFPALYSDA